MRDSPFGRYNWRGRIISVDGTSTDDFSDDDCADVIAYGDSGGGWDGVCAGVARLSDGRFIAWESDWGPTGSGFCGDAYGGDADVHVGATADAVIWMGLSASSRMLCGYPATRPE